MKNTLLMCAMLVGCGYTSRDNQLTGQVKKVIDNTPVICGDYAAVDISLGVVKNGTGSMSKEDVIMYVPHQKDEDLLKSAAKTGTLVNVIYNQARVVLCVPDDVVTSVELAQ
jgi:hypothetical protein